MLAASSKANTWHEKLLCPISFILLNIGYLCVLLAKKNTWHEICTGPTNYHSRERSGSLEECLIGE